MVLMRSTAGEEYIAELRSAYHGVRLYDPSYALSQDRDIWEKMLRDPHIRHLVDHRSRLVAGRTWRVVAGEEDAKAEQLLADVTRDALDGIRNFTRSRQKLAMDGIFQGTGYHYIEAHTTVERLAKTAKMRWRLPYFLKHIGHRRFRFDPEWRDVDGVRTATTVAKMWPLEYGDAINLSPEDAKSIIRVAYDDDESRLGYGRGLQDAMYFAFYAKMKLVQEGLDSAEVWARGLPVAKVNAEAHGGSGESSDQVAKDFLTIFRKMARDYGIAIDDRDDVEIKWPAGSGWQLIAGLLDRFDEYLDRLVLSSVRATGGGGDGGSLARSQIEQEEMDALVTSDRDVMDDALSHHLIGWFLRHNHENLVTLGLAGAKRPVFATGEETRDDPEESQGKLRTAIELGMDVDTTEAYDLLGLTPPDGVGPVIKGRAPDAGGLNPFGQSFDEIPRGTPPASEEQ